jgi:hypothetical protein
MSRLWNRIHQMGEEGEILAFAAEHRVDVSGTWDDLRTLQDFICRELNVERPAEVEEFEAEDADDPALELDRLARKHQRQHGVSYETAFANVRKQHAELAERYAESFPQGLYKTGRKA